MSRRQGPSPSLGVLMGTDENAMTSFGGLRGLAPPRGKLGSGAGGLQGTKKLSTKGTLGGLDTGKLFHSRTPGPEKSLGVYKDPTSSPPGKSGGVKIRKPRLALQNITNATPRQQSGASGYSGGKSLKPTLAHAEKTVTASAAPATKLPVSSATPTPTVSNSVLGARPVFVLPEARTTATEELDVDETWIDDLAAKYAAEGDGYETCGMTSDDLHLLLEQREAEEIKTKVKQLVSLRLPIPSMFLPYKSVFEDKPTSPSEPPALQRPDDPWEEDWVAGRNSLSMDESVFNWLDIDAGLVN